MYKMAAFLDEDGYIDQRVCRFYLVGKCMSGNSCRFLHCKELLKTKITWVCLHFLSSSGCTYGVNCKFDHPEWARGLFLLPKICGQYRHEKDGEKCPDADCKYLHFTEEEHQAYIKDRIIPERFDLRKKDSHGHLVQYSSDEEADQRRDDMRSRNRSKFGNGRNHDSRKDRSRSPRREMSPKRVHSRSRSPLRSSSRGSKREVSRELSPDTEAKRNYKMKRTIKDLRTELDDLWKDHKQLQRELSDHKRFHDSDQDLINDLMRTRNKLEEDINKLTAEKLDMSKQITDLFSDNQVVVEENQRLRGLLQSRESVLPSGQTVTPLAQSSYPDTFSSSSSTSTMFPQSTWN